MYVNSNPRDAKMVLSRSNNDVYMLIENRGKFYSEVAKNKPDKKHFEKGWNNRLEILKKICRQLLFKFPLKNAIN